MNRKWQIWVHFLPFDVGFKRRGSLCRYKSNIHTHTEPRVWCSDLVLTLYCFVCQLNNGLAGIKASHCHNYTPAVINPMCIEVIIVGTVNTPEHCISIQCYLFYLPRKGCLSPFPRNSFWHLHKQKKLTSGVAPLKPHFSVLDTWAASLEQLRCKLWSEVEVDTKWNFPDSGAKRIFKFQHRYFN